MTQSLEGSRSASFFVSEDSNPGECTACKAAHLPAFRFVGRLRLSDSKYCKYFLGVQGKALADSVLAAAGQILERLQAEGRPCEQS